LMDQAPLLRRVPAKFHKMELPPNLTVQKIPYIPYQIYQPASACNLPIPAKLPVNRWDTTLVILFPFSIWLAAATNTTFIRSKVQASTLFYLQTTTLLLSLSCRSIVVAACCCYHRGRGEK
jgi:hypothetical protein